jgi:DNA-binding MarR family transcriptional regulator
MFAPETEGESAPEVEPESDRAPWAVDRLVHEPARLAILANLFVVESADATYLLRQTELTWGNLSSHLDKLWQAGYVTVTKSFVDRRPMTMIELTPPGRAAFRSYRDQMMNALGSLPG